jgi:hypothetical protein
MIVRWLKRIAISSASAAAVALSLAALLTPVPGLEPQRTRDRLV